MDDHKWQDIYRRLAEANQKLANGITLGQHHRQQILKKRAQQLAKIELTGEKKENPLEVLEFRLAHETYALECRHIKEVSPLKAPALIPGTPDFVLGIINIRGQIVSVLDLAKFFQLPAKEPNHRTQIIVLENETMEFGIMAEKILGVTSIPAGEIQPPPVTLTGIRADYLKGIASNRLILLDAEKLLADEKIIVNQELEV